MSEYQVETKAVVEARREVGTMTEGEADPPAVLNVAIQHSPVKGVDAATLTDHQGPPSGDTSPFEAEESTAEQVLRRMRLQRLERGSSIQNAVFLLNAVEHFESYVPNRREGGGAAGPAAGPVEGPTPMVLGAYTRLLHDTSNLSL
jgi:hypothetical protein